MKTNKVYENFGADKHESDKKLVGNDETVDAPHDSKSNGTIIGLKDDIMKQ